MDTATQQMGAHTHTHHLSHTYRHTNLWTLYCPGHSICWSFMALIHVGFFHAFACIVSLNLLSLCIVPFAMQGHVYTKGNVFTLDTRV